MGRVFHSDWLWPRYACQLAGKQIKKLDDEKWRRLDTKIAFSSRKVSNRQKPWGTQSCTQMDVLTRTETKFLPMDCMTSAARPWKHFSKNSLSCLWKSTQGRKNRCPQQQQNVDKENLSKAAIQVPEAWLLQNIQGSNIPFYNPPWS